MKKRTKHPSPPRHVWADHADRKWAFYSSRKDQRSNRPDLHCHKFKLENLEEVEALRSRVDNLIKTLRQMHVRSDIRLPDGVPHEGHVMVTKGGETHCSYAPELADWLESEKLRDLRNDRVRRNDMARRTS